MPARVALNPYFNRWKEKLRRPPAEKGLAAAGVDFLTGNFRAPRPRSGPGRRSGAGLRDPSREDRHFNFLTVLSIRKFFLIPELCYDIYSNSKSRSAVNSYNLN